MEGYEVDNAITRTSHYYDVVRFGFKNPLQKIQTWKCTFQHAELRCTNMCGIVLMESLSMETFTKNLYVLTAKITTYTYLNIQLFLCNSGLFILI